MMKINEVVKLSPEAELTLDRRVRQVNISINDAGNDREKLAIEVIKAIASTQGIHVQVMENR